jgi:hypothetical protein
MKPSLQEERAPSAPLRTGEPVDPTALHIGDELICGHPSGRIILVRVARPKCDRDGQLVGFFPEAQPRVDPSVAIDVRRIVKAWRSPESKRD